MVYASQEKALSYAIREWEVIRDWTRTDASEKRQKGYYFGRFNYKILPRTKCSICNKDLKYKAQKFKCA